MRKICFILKLLTILLAAAVLTLCGYLCYFCLDTASGMHHSVIIYSEEGILDTSLPSADASELYTERIRETKDNTILFVEIEKKGDGVFHQHLAYDAMRDLYPQIFFPDEAVSVISLSEIKTAIYSISFIAMLIPLSLAALMIAIFIGNDLSNMVVKGRCITSRLIVMLALLTLFIGSVYVLSKQIRIPNSILPAKNIFDVSHYTGLYLSLQNIIKEYSCMPASLNSSIHAIPTMFSILKYESHLALCTATFACLSFFINEKRKRNNKLA